NRLARRHVHKARAIEHEQLGALVGDQRQGGGDQPHLARLQACQETLHAGSNAATACVQRLHRWVCGWRETSSSTIQQRAHLSPSAPRNITPTPGTSGNWNVPERPSPAIWKPDVIAMSFQVAASSSPASLLAQTRIGSASSEEPIFLSARASSSAPVTTRRNSRMRFHFSTSAVSVQAAGAAKKSCRWTLSSAPKRVVQTSSMVKHRMGAYQVTMQRKMVSITVRAARRRGASTGSQ